MCAYLAMQLIPIGGNTKVAEQLKVLINRIPKLLLSPTFSQLKISCFFSLLVNAISYPCDPC